MGTNLEMIKKDKNLMVNDFFEYLLCLVHGLLFALALPWILKNLFKSRKELYMTIGNVGVEFSDGCCKREK
jgi:hypothetical protein